MAHAFRQWISGPLEGIAAREDRDGNLLSYRRPLDAGDHMQRWAEENIPQGKGALLVVRRQLGPLAYELTVRAATEYPSTRLDEIAREFDLPLTHYH